LLASGAKEDDLPALVVCAIAQWCSDERSARVSLGCPPPPRGYQALADAAYPVLGELGRF
jgi:hypothetical protein